MPIHPISQPYNGPIKPPVRKKVTISKIDLDFYVDTILLKDINQVSNELMKSTCPSTDSAVQNTIIISTKPQNTYNTIMKNLRRSNSSHPTTTLVEYRRQLASQVGEENVDDLIALADQRYRNNVGKWKRLVKSK
jgi:hypothetical protein